MATSLNEKAVVDSPTAPSLTDDEAYANPTGLSEKKLLRKLDLKLLPALTLLYLLSFLDRSNSTYFAVRRRRSIV
jgi:hypothetical protein